MALIITQLLSGSTEAKEEHVSSSNLLYFEAVLHVCEHASAVVAVQQSFCYVPQTGSHSRSLIVDVVAHEGGSWIKVFARNRKALHSKWLGEACLNIGLCKDIYGYCFIPFVYR